MGLFNLEGMVQNIADAYIDIVARSKVSSPSNGSVVYCCLLYTSDAADERSV